jgi:hypothetical protein
MSLFGKPRRMTPKQRGGLQTALIRDINTVAKRGNAILLDHEADSITGLLVASTEFTLVEMLSDRSMRFMLRDGLAAFDKHNFPQQAIGQWLTHAHRQYSALKL